MSPVEQLPSIRRVSREVPQPAVARLLELGLLELWLLLLGLELGLLLLLLLLELGLLELGLLELGLLGLLLGLLLAVLEAVCLGSRSWSAWGVSLGLCTACLRPVSWHHPCIPCSLA